MKVMVINGPNLNELGRREPELYGSMTLPDLEKRLADAADRLGVQLGFYQSNHEGELVDAIQLSGREYDGVILNAGGYTHTSVAVRDAVAACQKPVVEVHISNPQAREDFRHVSLLAGVCVGSISGFGWQSYILAVTWFARVWREPASA